MKKHFRKIFALCLALALPVGSIQAASTAPASAKLTESAKLTDKPVKFTYWVGLSGNAAATINNYKDNAMYKEMEKRTGVQIEFLHPTIGQETEQFNLMVASRDLPDLIEYGWGSYPGGPEKAIADKIIINLTDLIKKNAPNAKALMESSPVVAKQSKSDNGSFYAFMPVGETNGNTQAGLIVRADWMKDLNLKDPKTKDEITSTLVAFKDKKGAVTPFTGTPSIMINNDFLSGMWGVGSTFYQKDGNVMYGPMQPVFKEFLAYLKNWYDKGLLDPDFASNDGKAVDAKVTGGKAGMFYGFASSGLGTYLAAKKDDPVYDLKAIEYPKMVDGKDPLFHHRAWEVRTSGQLAITTVNKNPELATKWADYFYTKDGGLLKNFGIEGLSYKIVNGQVEYTDLLNKNPDGLSVQKALAIYSRGDTPSPGPVLKTNSNVPRVAETVDIWNKYSDNATLVLLPPITQTPDEASKLAKLTTNVNAYTDEMLVKYIMGQESLDKFDAFVAQLKKLDIETIISLRQAALTRYNSR